MECVTRFSTSFFWHDLNPSGPLIDRLKYFQILFWFHWNIRSQSLKNSTSWCAWHQGVKILSFFKSFLSWYMYIFIRNGFILIVPLKATRDSQRFWFWLRGVHFYSAVWCPPQSLTPRYDAHRGAWLHRGMHTAELDSAVWCTPQSLIPRCASHCGVRLLQKCSFSGFRICYIFQQCFIKKRLK